jgi:hypothetical protein
VKNSVKAWAIRQKRYGLKHALNNEGPYWLRPEDASIDPKSEVIVEIRITEIPPKKRKKK